MLSSWAEAEPPINGATADQVTLSLRQMESVEDIVIVGAGVAGLSTALGLHRLGIRCLVLESSENLRATGFAFQTWSNAWIALDALGIGATLRSNHQQLMSCVVSSTVTGLPISETPFVGKGKHGDIEVRCLRRKELLLELAKDLPTGTVRFCAKVLSITEEKYRKMVHLVDGSIIKTKVLIGCDGVNSLVAKWLGLGPSSFTGRWAIRGFAKYLNGHKFEPKLFHFFGNGIRYGVRPCDDYTMVWFFTYYPSAAYNNIEKETDPAILKQFVADHLGNVPDEIKGIVRDTTLSSIISTPIRYRRPTEVLWPGAIYKDNVCIAGDALHPMTPDVAQGACAALEDGVILARKLSEVLLGKETEGTMSDEEEYTMIRKCLKKYADERKWRSCGLMVAAYLCGKMQQSPSKVANIMRENGVASFMSSLYLTMGDFDCGKLERP